MSGLCSNALGFNEVPKRMLKGWGVGCPVLNLQERLRILETPYNNETQDQLTQVLTKQESLQQRMDNFIQIPGWSLPTELGLSRENESGEQNSKREGPETHVLSGGDMSAQCLI